MPRDRYSFYRREGNSLVLHQTEKPSLGDILTVLSREFPSVPVGDIQVWAVGNNVVIAGPQQPL